MAVTNPFFTKREPQTFNARTAAAPQQGHVVSTEPAMLQRMPDTALALAEKQSAPLSSEVAAQGGSKLTVGPNIKLKGVEITDCDTLVVEGTVEATMDSRVIHIAHPGAFHGSAQVDIAEIHGEFTGSLTVRQKLLIHSTGKVSGKVRYGKIVMEEGGQLSGEIVFGTDSKPAPVAKPKDKDSAAAVSVAAG